MSIETPLLILLACIVSIAIAWFQYHFKRNGKGKLYVLLSFLRFLTLFSLFLILINPKLTKTELSVEKPNLIVLIDNSASIAEQGGVEEITSVLNQIGKNNALSDKFTVEKYSFGLKLNDSTSTSFTEKSTNISQALAAVNAIYANGNGAVLLLTDGNQTIGEDYEFFGKEQKKPIYPIAIGDTTKYQDLRIDRLNSNRYAFLKNKYPIEIFTSYEGPGNISTKIVVTVDDKIVFQENVSFSKTNNYKIITALFDANSVGVKNVMVKVVPFNSEKNIFNNEKKIAIEVIDEQTTIAIISDIAHPDVGALKKAIESNGQRSVAIRKSTTDFKVLEDTDLFILYQPDPSFRAIYELIEKKKANVFTVTGPKTDWNFLNTIQNSFTKENYGQTEEITPVPNPAFTIFDITDFSVEGFPPLESTLGGIVLKKQGFPILNQRIKGIELEDPLLALIGDGPEREVVLFGENVWKWRMQSFRNDQDFHNFDGFIGKIVLYLSMTTAKNRFNVDYSPVYPGSRETRITATYFDETFVFNDRATIVLKLTEEGSGISKEMPMLLKGAYYEADLSNLNPGSYNFIAMVQNDNLSKSGRFIVGDFDVEKQFQSTDHLKLNRLAKSSMGKLYYPSETNTLIQDLIEDRQFLPTQKSKQNVVSLIDFRFLLIVIMTTLTLEWFIRKYNGLI